MDLNNVVVTGNMVADPEMKKLDSGKSVLNGRIAVQGKRDEDVTFLAFQLWNKPAEYFYGLDIKKGTKVMLHGILIQDNWTDKQSGQKRSKICLNAWTANRISFKKKAGQQQDSSTARYGPGDFPQAEDDGVPF